MAADIPDYFTDVDYDEGDDLNFTPDSPKQVSAVSVDNFTNNHQPILLGMNQQNIYKKVATYTTYNAIATLLLTLSSWNKEVLWLYSCFFLVLGSEGSGVPEELLEIIKEKIFVSPSRIVDLSGREMSEFPSALCIPRSDFSEITRILTIFQKLVRIR